MDRVEWQPMVTPGRVKLDSVHGIRQKDVGAAKSVEIFFNFMLLLPMPKSSTIEVRFPAGDVADLPSGGVSPTASASVYADLNTASGGSSKNFGSLTGDLNSVVRGGNVVQNSVYLSSPAACNVTQRDSTDDYCVAAHDPSCGGCNGTDFIRYSPDYIVLARKDLYVFGDFVVPVVNGTACLPGQPVKQLPGTFVRSSGCNIYNVPHSNATRNIEYVQAAEDLAPSSTVAFWLSGIRNGIRALSAPGFFDISVKSNFGGKEWIIARENSYASMQMVAGELQSIQVKSTVAMVSQTTTMQVKFVHPGALFGNSSIRFEFDQAFQYVSDGVVQMISANTTLACPNSDCSVLPKIVTSWNTSTTIYVDIKILSETWKDFNFEVSVNLCCFRNPASGGRWAALKRLSSSSRTGSTLFASNVAVLQSAWVSVDPTRTTRPAVTMVPSVADSSVHVRLSFTPLGTVP